MSLISQASIDNDEVDWNSLEDEFIVCLKKIKYRTNEISDGELGSIRVISGGSIFGEISELAVDSPRENIIEGWEIPKGVPERAITIIIFFLNSGRELSVAMRDYLSAGLESAIAPKGIDLQDSFNLKSHNENNEKKKLLAKIGTYIDFRYKLNVELAKRIKSDYTKSGYTKSGQLNSMLYDELLILFKYKVTDHKKLGRLHDKRTGSSFLFSSLSHMLRQNRTKTLMYIYCLKHSLENKKENAGVTKFKTKVLELLEKSMKD
ncbi:TPA: hypothetical protein ACW0SX_002711 [Enterobacter soli]|uniref:hypothetical protein n=1 Tax=Citrobacter freundii TaxID=546 RepID=UPI0015EA0BA3|nr:hypothetical protein [Citrobacter freundii]QLX24475.1 hypothetical protein HV271_06435 [Citrobacter freundii]